MDEQEGTLTVGHFLHAMWEVIEEVAKEDSGIFINDWDDRECAFCEKTQIYVRLVPFPHKEDCVVIKARALIIAERARTVLE